MKQMKYLVYCHSEYNYERLFIFPEAMKHKDFADSLSLEGWKPIRGGFISNDYDKLCCYGEAYSLGLSADKDEDTKLLNSQI